MLAFLAYWNATKIASSHTADSKPVKQEVNSTVILPPLVFPGLVHATRGRSNLVRVTMTPCQ
jgi:hypothetical protein